MGQINCAPNPVLVFEINQVRHGKYPEKIFVRRSIFHWKTIYRSVFVEVNLKSPQISAHKDDVVSFLLLFCVRPQPFSQANIKWG